MTGDGYTLEQIDDYVEQLEKELLLVPGVARVAKMGALQEAVFVEISASRATQLGIPLPTIYPCSEWRKCT